MAPSQRVGLVRSLKNLWNNSPWIVIAVTVHVIAFAILSVLTFRSRSAPHDDAIVLAPSRETAPLPAIPLDDPPLVRQSVPKQDERVELVSLDDVDLTPVLDPSRDLKDIVGDPNSKSDVDLPSGASSSIGAGAFGGVHGVVGGLHIGTGLGPIHHGHPPELPPKGTQEAVLLGLRWLARHQLPDGSWSIARLREVCVTDHACLQADQQFSAHYDEGLTALATLAFLGAGYGHDARALLVDDVKGQRHFIGPDIVKPALHWLCDRQKPDGSFSAEKPFLYNEALGAMALCEAYGLTQAKYWKAPAQRAIDFLVSAQKRSPLGQGSWGWRYGPREDVTSSGAADEANGRAAFESDTSVTTWCVMALKSAQLAGLEVPQASLDGALNFVQWVSAKDGRVGYLDPAGAGLAVAGVNDQFQYHAAVMSALSMCSRIFVNHDPSDPFLESGANWLVRDLPVITRDRLSIDYYYWYYGSLALNQLDGPESPKHTGKYWNAWNKSMAESLLALQERAKGECSQGAWLTPDRWSYTGGPVYATAMNVLTLEVYYRFANAFGAKPAPKRAAAVRGR